MKLLIYPKSKKSEPFSFPTSHETRVKQKLDCVQVVDKWPVSHMVSWKPLAPCDASIKWNICLQLLHHVNMWRCSAADSSRRHVHKHLEITEGQQTRPRVSQATFGVSLAASCAL